MAQIVVTAAEVRAKAQELRQRNSDFKNQVQELVSIEQNLGSKWEGEAKNAFHRAFMDDQRYMDQFYSLIEKYVAAMEQIAAEYERQERQNQQIASTRTS
ncbi:MAG: WXG100 family type VII secretion target [Lachnospiraceae bacterium]|nr:WXG100 family type VII secretion target [Lachnospiraceae bacterium]